jgi:hypothetical protein
VKYSSRANNAGIKHRDLGKERVTVHVQGQKSLQEALGWVFANQAFATQALFLPVKTLAHSKPTRLILNKSSKNLLKTCLNLPRLLPQPL